jgi:hypothetical protein
MCYSDISVAWKRRLAAAPAAVLLTLALGSAGCGVGTGHPAGLAEYSEQVVPPHVLALWFAPDLYLNPSEPFELVAVVPVLHPSKSLVAYHMFFEDDALLAGRGKELDHEVIWVEYDAVTLKVADVMTLWHRTVLRTDVCASDARIRGQHPRICVQWGQHGMLPFGWERLISARPRLELLLHYEFASYINRIPKASRTKPKVVFSGSYDAYVTFTRQVDTSGYIAEAGVVVAEYCDEELQSRIDGSFMLKKQWPDW